MMIRQSSDSAVFSAILTSTSYNKLSSCKGLLSRKKLLSLLRCCWQAALLTLCVASVSPLASAQEHVSISPAAKSFKLGAFDVSVLRDGANVIPNNGKTFGLNATPAAVAKVLHKAGAEKIHLDIDALLIRMPEHIVLIDTGLGPAGHGILLQSLALTGVKPASVTDIFITHSHPDHVGGLVDAHGKPAFPKAVIRMSAKEWAFMQSNKALAAEVTAIKSQVQTFVPGHAILPGITSIALVGHTPGHTGYEIDSQGHKLIDIGDIVHNYIVSLARPDWTIAWDSDKQQGVLTRERELQRLAKDHEWMFAPHFPFPGVGHIEKADEGYSFKPGLPQASTFTDGFSPIQAVNVLSAQ